MTTPTRLSIHHTYALTAMGALLHGKDYKTFTADDIEQLAAVSNDIADRMFKERAGRTAAFFNAEIGPHDRDGMGKPQPQHARSPNVKARYDVDDDLFSQALRGAIVS